MRALAQETDPDATQRVAALRYQLTEDDGDVPRFGTVILDEAFDKADHRFTWMATDVFQEFGFHMC